MMTIDERVNKKLIEHIGALTIRLAQLEAEVEHWRLLEIAKLNIKEIKTSEASGN